MKVGIMWSGMLLDRCLRMVASPSRTPEFLKFVSSTFAATTRCEFFRFRLVGVCGVDCGADCESGGVW